MEAVVLIGGFLYIAVVGYLAVSRLGRFLDRGGISPYWDREDEQLAQSKKEAPAVPDAFEQQAGCNTPHSKVV